MKLNFTYLTLIAVLFAGTTMAQSTKLSDKSRSIDDYRLAAFGDNEAKLLDGTLETNGYTPDATLDIQFTLNLTNEDLEYGDSISITFPAGFTINSVSNDDVFGPSFDDNPDNEEGDPEPFNGIDGQTVTWGDNDNVWGGITATNGGGDNIYTFSINATVDAGVTGEQTGDFFVSGDGFADPAGDLTGTFTMTEGQAVTIFSIVEGSDVHETLETALIASGLDAVTADVDVDLTLFAPTDAAFDLLPDGALQDLLDDPTGALVNVLLYHVLGEGLLDTELGTTELTLQGETVTIGSDGTNATVNDVVISLTNLEADNGVVHVIDAVLLPEFCTSVAAAYAGFFVEGGDVAPVADSEGVCPTITSGFEAWASEVYFVNDFVTGTMYTFGLAGGASGAWVPQLLVINGTTGEIIATGEEGDLTLDFEVPTDGTYGLMIHEVGFCGGQSTNLEVDNGFPFLTCQGLTSTTDLTSVVDLSVFPNPAVNQFTVELELNATEDVTIDVLNTLGQVVKSVDLGTRSAGFNREYIDVNDLSEGIYLMNLTVGNTQGTVKVQVVR